MNIEEIVRILAAGGTVTTIHLHEGTNIHDNQIDTLCLNNEQKNTRRASRLSLFVTDEDKLNTFFVDLGVCESTSDVCRAVEKLGDGRIACKYKEMDFAAAVLPYLKFNTTKSALYQALNKIA